MAWIDQAQLTAKGTQYYTVDADGVLNLGQPAPKSVGTFAFQVDAAGASFSIVVKGRVRGSGLTGANIQPIPYQYLQDGTAIDKLSSVAITVGGIFYVRGDFLEVFLDVDWTSGAPVIYVLGGAG